MWHAAHPEVGLRGPTWHGLDAGMVGERRSPHPHEVRRDDAGLGRVVERRGVVDVCGGRLSSAMSPSAVAITLQDRLRRVTTSTVTNGVERAVLAGEEGRLQPLTRLLRELVVLLGRGIPRLARRHVRRGCAPAARGREWGDNGAIDATHLAGRWNDKLGFGHGGPHVHRWTGEWIAGHGHGTAHGHAWDDGGYAGLHLRLREEHLLGGQVLAMGIFVGRSREEWSQETDANTIGNGVDALRYGAGP